MTVTRYTELRPLDRALVAALHTAHYASDEYAAAQAWYADATARLLAAELPSRPTTQLLVILKAQHNEHISQSA